ncbi:hypothetical protein [Dyella humicola]|uniref:hypothetical protein n=1 Tax=Dyella humicola TaxID=2992126 RepID=UPI002257F950|nr:hypothetical protein [Dyella humicola]
MSLSFRGVAVAAGVICLVLALVWMVVPSVLLWLWRIDAAASAELMARRGAALFLGVGIMLLMARDAGPSPARGAIATGLSVSCATLAVLGIYEFVLGHAGVGIWLAIVVEIALAAGFLVVRRSEEG